MPSLSAEAEPLKLQARSVHEVLNAADGLTFAAVVTALVVVADPPRSSVTVSATV